MVTFEGFIPDFHYRVGLVAVINGTGNCDVTADVWIVSDIGFPFRVNAILDALIGECCLSDRSDADK